MTEPIFTSRQSYLLEMPLKNTSRILHPEQVILRIGYKTFDVGALCYALRSNKQRESKKPMLVFESSLLTKRRKAIKQIIKVVSELMVGTRPHTVYGMMLALGMFVDWADSNNHPECLASGESSERALLEYLAHVEDIFRQGDIEAPAGFARQTHVLKLLKAITCNPELGRGFRLIRDNSQAMRKGTEPANSESFAHTLSMAQMLFDGITDFLNNNKPFPYKLILPKSLNWETGNHLWIFPANVWNMPPRLWGEERVMLGKPHWAYDYQNGRLATEDEVWHRYKGQTRAQKFRVARKFIADAQSLIEKSNEDQRHRTRIQLASLAQNAFLLLFIANTGGNISVVREIEAGETIDVGVVNQHYRAVKYRAYGKIVTLRVPTRFMPSLRKFMDLRKYLLGEKNYPYLFFALGVKQKKIACPAQITGKGLDILFDLLKEIDPEILVIRARQIRATVNDWYLRHHEAAITAKVMGHSEKTENIKYGRGSSIDYHEDMTVLLQKISEVAKAQKVVVMRKDLGQSLPLEQGGMCNDYENPRSMLDNPLLEPSCEGGCLFCEHRCLVADEEDVRKIASAAFLMEQLILGPAHENNLRPMIRKCEEDMDAIARIGDCAPLVNRIKMEVYDEGEMTPFWAEKYHLFLELGLIV